MPELEMLENIRIMCEHCWLFIDLFIAGYLLIYLLVVPNCTVFLLALTFASHVESSLNLPVARGL